MTNGIYSLSASLLRAVAAVAIVIFSNGSGVVADNRSLQNESNNWDLEYVDLTGYWLTANPDDQNDQFIMNYEIGKSREHVAELLAKGCVDDINIGISQSLAVRESINGTHDTLSVGYSIDNTTMIAGSNIWTNATNAIEFCAIEQLVLPASGSTPMLVIASDKREFVINVDMTVTFDLNANLTMSPVTSLKWDMVGSMAFTNVNPPSTAEEYGSTKTVLEESMAEVVVEGLDGEQELLNVTVLTIGGNTLADFNSETEGPSQIPGDASRRTLLGTSCAQSAQSNVNDIGQPNTEYKGQVLDILQAQNDEGQVLGRLQAQNEGTNLQAQNEGTNLLSVEYVLSLQDSCRNEVACAVMMNSTTMHDSVTSEISTQIESGGLAETIQTKAISAGLALLGAVAVNCSDLDPGEPEIIAVVESRGYVSTSANTNNYVRSCKCDGAQSFTCNTDTLFPNEELLLCIWSTSQFLQSGVLDSMILNQAGGESLEIIKSDQVLFPSFTKREYVANKNGFAVSTQVPMGLFSFGTDESITITGVMELELVGSDERRLRDVTSGANSIEKAPFQLKINLTKELKPDKVQANSATVTSEGFAVMGMVCSFVYTVLW